MIEKTLYELPIANKEAHMPKHCVFNPQSYNVVFIIYLNDEYMAYYAYERRYTKMNILGHYPDAVVVAVMERHWQETDAGYIGKWSLDLDTSDYEALAIFKEHQMIGLYNEANGENQ